jgi:hypothetical protein
MQNVNEVIEKIISEIKNYQLNREDNDNCEIIINLGLALFDILDDEEQRLIKESHRIHNLKTTAMMAVYSPEVNYIR